MTKSTARLPITDAFALTATWCGERFASTLNIALNETIIIAMSPVFPSKTDPDQPAVASHYSLYEYEAGATAVHRVDVPSEKEARVALETLFAQILLRNSGDFIPRALLELMAEFVKKVDEAFRR